MRRLFGTDGVRGVANQHPMTCEIALALGRAVAFQAKNGTHRHRIIIGKDTRLSGYMLEMAFASGVCSMGVDAVLLGPLPTPAVAFLTRDMRADAGVVISASHNSYEDNGIKIFARDGFKLPDQKESELERLLEDKEVGAIRPTRDAVGKAFRIDDALGRYIGFLKSAFPVDLDLEGLKVVVDCANGAAYRVAPMVLEELGAEVISLSVQPNGRNINHQCGALFPERIGQAVQENRAHVGIALDGDADRLIVVDNLGNVVDGDRLLAIAARDLLAKDKLSHKTVVATVMSNLALEHTLQSWGAKLTRVQVGDRYVVDEMRRGGYTLGGEQSGHIVYLEHISTGDGMLAALKLLATLKRQATSMHELAEVLQPYPQVLLNVAVREKTPFDEIPAVQSVIEQAQKQLGTNGRVLVRYSGTEKKARVMVEGPEADRVTDLAQKIATTIKEAMG